MTTICPRCGNIATAQPSVSPDYVLVTCFNTVEKKMANKQTKSERCGYKQFIKIKQMVTHDSTVIG